MEILERYWAATFLEREEGQRVRILLLDCSFIL